MNVMQFRELMQSALRNAGLEEHEVTHRRPKVPNVWALPADDIVRYFWPGAYRRPWGFVYSGSLAVEIPELRKWLTEHKQGDAGIFHTCFVGYNIMNEEVLGGFMVEHDKTVPADLWAGLLRDRLAQIPSSLEGLVDTYRRNKEILGWLAHPHQRHAWDFLMKWVDNPDPGLHVPKMLPDGQIA